MKRWEVTGYIYNLRGRASNGKFSNLASAKESAQAWVLGKTNRSAEICNRITGQVKMRYWNDGRLQYLEF